MQDLGNGVEIILEEPEQKTHSAVIFIPGMSGEALTSKYEKFSQAVLERGYACLRLQSWHGPADMARKTPNMILDDIQQGIDFLKEKGYTKIVAIGKSFGGAMLLLRHDPSIDTLILWAPGLHVVPAHGSIRAYVDIPIAAVKSPKEVSVDYDFLSGIRTPLYIIHGTSDGRVPIDNSRTIQQHVAGSHLKEIAGLDHSWKTPEEETGVIEALTQYLT